MYKGEFSDKYFLNKIIISDNFRFSYGGYDDDEDCQLQSNVEIYFIGTQEQWEIKRVKLKIPSYVKVTICAKDPD